MTNDRPLFSADWHARRAEHFADLAASMNGWWQRGRRRDLLAAAQVHATLGAVAMPAGNYVERLGQGEADTEAANARATDLADDLLGVERALRGYGQDLLADCVSPAEAVERLMAQVHNAEQAKPDQEGS